MTEPMLQTLLSFARDLAIEAGELEMRFFRRSHARRKQDGTLITEADDQADQLICARIRAAYPEHAVLSEEGTTHYDASVRYTWVVDPLDGTTNFARGFAIWGVSIALLRDGAPIVAALHFPLLGETYEASLGNGAFCNGEPLAVDAESAIDDVQIFTQCSRSRRRFHVDTPMKARMLGSAAYHLLSIATGSTLASLDSTAKLWDLAAAYLVVTEAGGIVAYLDGSPIFPLPPTDRDYAARSEPVLTAATEEIFTAMQACIQPSQN